MFNLLQFNTFWSFFIIFIQILYFYLTCAIFNIKTFWFNCIFFIQFLYFSIFFIIFPFNRPASYLYNLHTFLIFNILEYFILFDTNFIFSLYHTFISLLTFTLRPRTSPKTIFFYTQPIY